MAMADWKHSFSYTLSWKSKIITKELLKGMNLQKYKQEEEKKGSNSIENAGKHMDRWSLT
jgi:hypothetical protein